MATSIAPMHWSATAKEALTPTEEEMKRRDQWSAPPCPSGTCAIPLHILIAFDGTNNNMDRDLPDRGHTNVARLFRAFPDAKGRGNLNQVGHYSYYVPGVGTPFPANLEWRESAEGKAQGKGARARVMMGVADVFNAVHRYLQNNQALLSGSALTEFIQETSLHSGAAPLAFNPQQRQTDVYIQPHAVLERAFRVAASHSPTPGKLGLGPIQVHVFGFSRGAMQAVAFCHEFAKAFPKGTLCGVPISIQFLGLMDCVASVGLADTGSRMGLMPVSGHFGEGSWVTQALPGCVKKAVHLVAAHEQRTAFPLDLVQGANMDTYVYPGVHSNVGGGYGLNAQGRAPSDGLMLSQIALMHMHRLARSYGVPLLPFLHMDPGGQQDFALDGALVGAWNKFMLAMDFDHVRATQGTTAAWPFFEQPNENGLKKCGDYKLLFRQYMRMRYHQLAEYMGVYHVTSQLLGKVSPQDNEDLYSSVDRLRADHAVMTLYLGPGKKEWLVYDADQQVQYERLKPKASKLIATLASRNSRGGSTDPMTDWDPPWIFWAYQQLDAHYHKRPECVVGIGDFDLLHRYVNDSLAGFYFLGFSSDAEKAEKIEDVVAKHQAGKKLNALETRIERGYWDRVEVAGDKKYRDIINKRLEARSRNMPSEVYAREQAYTPAEAKYLSSSKLNRTVIPTLTDADVPMLLQDRGALERVVIPGMTTSRREGGGYLAQRGVFINGKHQSLLG